MKLLATGAQYKVFDLQNGRVKKQLLTRDESRAVIAVGMRQILSLWRFRLLLMIRLRAKRVNIYGAYYLYRARYNARQSRF